MSLSSLEERFLSLKAQYIDALPDLAIKLERLLQKISETPDKDRYSCESLFICVHGLMGTAATFGLESISREASYLVALIQPVFKDKVDCGELFHHKFSEHLVILRQTIVAVQTEMQQLQEQGGWHQKLPLGFSPEARRIFACCDQEDLLKKIDERGRRLGFKIERFASLDDLRQAILKEMPLGVLVSAEDQNQTPPEPLAFSHKHGHMMAPVPVIVVADEDRFSARLWAARLGHTHFVCQPVNIYQLIHALRAEITMRADAPYRVLVVDDDPMLAELYRAVLEEAGLVVNVSHDPEKAFRRLRRFTPDLVVLDLHMRGCNGIELASVFHRLDGFQQLPILFLSGSQDLGQRLHDYNLAHEDYLIKPVYPTALVRVVLRRLSRVQRRNRDREHLQGVLLELENIQFALNRHAIVSITDISGRITYVNEKFCEVSGYTQQELLDKTHRIVKSGYHSLEFYQEMWGTILQGKVWHGQVKNRRKDGGFYWVAATIIPFLNKKGKPYEYVSIRTDITQQKQAEGQRRSMALFAEMNPAPVMRVNGKGILIEANPAAWQMVKPLKLKARIGHHVSKMLPGVEQVDFVSCIKNDENINFGIRFDHRYFNFNVQGVSDLGVAHVYGSDITEQKIAEETLRESDERIRAIVQSAMEGIVVLDSEGLIELFNPGAERIFGFSAEEMIGERIFNLLPQTREIFSQIQSAQSMDHGVDQGESRTLGLGYEMTGQKKGGEEVSLELLISEFFLGKRRMFTGVVHDITQRKKEERELRLAKDMAEKASRAKSEFLSGMSHELRTPMNAVLGFAQLLESDPDEPLSENQQDSIQEIMKAGTHLLELINEILDLAKIEAGKLKLKITDVALRDVLQESLTLVQTLANQNDVILRCTAEDMACDHYLVQADHTRLKQVLLNLLSNAIKYNRPQGLVSIRCALDEYNQVKITVSDTGVGIAEENIATVFEPFDRIGAEHSGIEGTGIGLVITKRLVEQMGGTVGLESRMGEGSSFWLTLPLSEVVHGVETSDSSSSVAQVQAEDLQKQKRLTLLYIEDNPTNLKLVERLVKRCPCHIAFMAAEDGLSGLEMIEREAPDIILLDINLPGMNGFEILSKLQERNLVDATPVIAVSANAMPDDIQRGERAGFFRYLTKPLAVDLFMDALNEAIEQVLPEALKLES
ncbi:response regulator [Magnetococcales bacterium HHB-1]